MDDERKPVAAPVSLRRLDNDLRESMERLERDLPVAEHSSDVTWTVSRKVRIHRETQLAAYVKGGAIALSGLLVLGVVGGVSLGLGVLVERKFQQFAQERSEVPLSPEGKRELLAALGSGGLSSSHTGTAAPGGGLSSSNQYAFFEFAPLSGAGMGSPCAGTTPTGAKGEALTFSRASAATCDKSNGSTGILPGDLVPLTSGQPRVATGGSGAPKLGVFEARTNLVLRSADPGDVAWSKEVGVTASSNDPACPLAPDGTQTMALVTFNGTSGKGLGQAVTISINNNVTHSIYVAQKTSGAAACVLGLKDWAFGGGITNVTVQPTASRVVFSIAVTGTASGPYLREVTAGDCVDACVWGGQTEQATAAISVGPYIPTLGTSATRVAEAAYFAVPVVPPFPIASLAATAIVESTWVQTAAAYNVLVQSESAAGKYFMVADRTASNGVGCETNSDSATVRSMNATPLVSGNRVACSVTGSGGTTTGYLNGAAVAAGASTGTLTTVHTTISIGAYRASVSPAHWLNGWVGQVCLDPDPSRCR